ncbi:hypothetical protein BDZ85DRAFT_252553 [Elsinoe ampelina]|uniref:Uncharacterized protein n=1 Tax=Elsinoe ampelina TaxID=302913 RepID=A0A6A6G2Q0_9PEZI|nr:hypothetical protein BDZ85DRAFT_252553 [Elsinoe ampelina]
MVGERLSALSRQAWFSEHPDRWMEYEDFRGIGLEEKNIAKSIWISIHPWATKSRIKFQEPSEAERSRMLTSARPSQQSSMGPLGGDHMITVPPMLAMDAPEALAVEEQQLRPRKRGYQMRQSRLLTFFSPSQQAISRDEIGSVPTAAIHLTGANAVAVSRTRPPRRGAVLDPHDHHGSCILGCSHSGVESVAATDSSNVTGPAPDLLGPVPGTSHTSSSFGAISAYIPAAGAASAAESAPLAEGMRRAPQVGPSTATHTTHQSSRRNSDTPTGLGGVPVSRSGPGDARISANLPDPARATAKTTEKPMGISDIPRRRVSLFVSGKDVNIARISSLMAFPTPTVDQNEPKDNQVEQFHQALRRKRPADDSEGDMANLAYKIRRLECGVSDRHTAELQAPQPDKQRAALVSTAAGPLTNLAIEGRVPKTIDNPFGLNHKEILDACLLSQRVREWMGFGNMQSGSSVVST